MPPGPVVQQCLSGGPGSTFSWTIETMRAARSNRKGVKAASRPFRVPGTLFLLSTLGQRLGIWVSGFPFPIVLLLSPFVVAYGLMHGRLKFSFTRGLLFTALIASIAISFLLGRAEWSSAQSAILFAAMYAPWALLAPTTLHEYKSYVRRIAFWVSIFSILAAVQFLGQYAYKSELWFSWRTVIPQEFLIEYNTLNEINWGSAIYKGNGLFLLEPSTLSGLIARVFLLTVLVLGEVRYALPFVIGLLFTFSGTGIVFTLMFTLPVFALRLARGFQPVPALILVSLISIVLVILWSSTFVGDYFVVRLNEFSDPRASGYARFTSTLFIFERHVMTGMGEFLIGYGPGSFKYVAGGTAEEVFGSGWIKLFVEYGLLGFVTFSAFFLHCVYSSTRSIYLSLALLTQFLVLDGGVLVPQLAFLSYAIFVLPVHRRSP